MARLLRSAKTVALIDDVWASGLPPNVETGVHLHLARVEALARVARTKPGDAAVLSRARDALAELAPVAKRAGDMDALWTATTAVVEAAVVSQQPEAGLSAFQQIRAAENDKETLPAPMLAAAMCAALAAHETTAYASLLSLASTNDDTKRRVFAAMEALASRARSWTLSTLVFEASRVAGVTPTRFWGLNAATKNNGAHDAVRVLELVLDVMKLGANVDDAQMETTFVALANEARSSRASESRLRPEHVRVLERAFRVSLGNQPLSSKPAAAFAMLDAFVALKPSTSSASGSHNDNNNDDDDHDDVVRLTRELASSGALASAADDMVARLLARVSARPDGVTLADEILTAAYASGSPRVAQSTAVSNAVLECLSREAARITDPNEPLMERDPAERLQRLRSAGERLVLKMCDADKEWRTRSSARKRLAASKFTSRPNPALDVPPAPFVRGAPDAATALGVGRLYANLGEPQALEDWTDDLLRDGLLNLRQLQAERELRILSVRSWGVARNLPRAVSVVGEMQVRGLAMDAHVVDAIVKACLANGAYNEGVGNVVAICSAHAFPPLRETLTALLRAAEKAGDADEAARVRELFAKYKMSL